MDLVFGREVLMKRDALARQVGDGLERLLKVA
jgi:hypothetical protein